VMRETRNLPLKLRFTEYSYPHSTPIRVQLGVVQGEIPPRWPFFCPFNLQMHSRFIKQPQTRYRGVRIAPLTVAALEGLAKIDILLATSPQLEKICLVLKLNPSASHSIRKAWAKNWVKATLRRSALGERGRLFMRTSALHVTYGWRLI
jgi:hypothetical protein